MGHRIDRGFGRKRGALSLRRRPDFFICHNSRDKPFAKELGRALSKVGVDPFLDSWEIEPGESLHRCVGIALEKSRYVGVVISPFLARSEWCMDELMQSLAREKNSKTKVIIPILYKNAPRPAFLADRLYVDFRKNFYSGIVRVCQIVHRLALAPIDAQLDRKSPKNMTDVARILDKCGWNNSSSFEASKFDEFLKALRKKRVPHTIDKQGNFVIEIEDLHRHWDDVSHLEVGETLLELYRPSFILATVRAMDLRDPESFTRILKICRNQKISWNELSDVLDCSKSTIARWSDGVTSPHRAIRQTLAEQLVLVLEQHFEESEGSKSAMSA